MFHAGFSFIPGMIPGIWAFNDSSPSVAISVLLFTSHIFRMSLFFFIAGFFARMMFERNGARGFWSNRCEAHSRSADRRLGRHLPGGRRGLDLGADEDLRRRLPAAPAAAARRRRRCAFPLTHLWFLYYLLVLYVIVLLGRADRRQARSTWSDPWSSRTP